MLACGVFLLISGARELLLPIMGQREISADWEASGISRSPIKGTPRDLGGAVCRLLIPRLEAHLFVVQGTGKEDLRIGPGHMRGSALPGAAGNCIIAGHRDTHFRVLKDLRKGDDIVLETPTREFHYRVTHMSVVSPHDRQVLEPASSAVLSLITCYPFYYVGPAPKQFVVRAALETQQP